MAFTGKLGSANSQLGSIELGFVGAPIQSASNTLIITQSATLSHGIILRGASNNLSFAQSARILGVRQFVANFLPLTQIIAAVKIYKRTSTQNLIYVQAASVSQIRKSSNVLTFNQSVTVTKFKGVGNTLTFTQLLVSAYNPHYEHVGQAFTISQTAINSHVIAPITVNPIVFIQSVSLLRVKALLATNVIVFRANAITARIGSANNVLVLSQSIQKRQVFNRAVSNVLMLNQSLQRTVTYRRSINHNLIFNNTYFKQTEIAGNMEVIPIPQVMVTKPTPIVVLRTSGRAITFREPLFGDSEGGLSKLIQQRTTNGLMYTYVRRVDSRKLKYTFEIPRPKALEIRSYILDNLSTPMYLENWKGEVWYGYIVNNPFAITAKRRAATCDSTEDSEIAVEFEGVKVH